MNGEFEDKLVIRELIENWVVWSDAGEWDRFKTIWHDHGYKSATFFECTSEEFTNR